MKVTMVNSMISFRNKIDSHIKIIKNINSGSFLNAENDISHHKAIVQEYKKYSGEEINGKRVLDLSCGQLAFQTFLFTIDGANVTGIDLEVPTYKLNLPLFIKIVKTNGFERAIKSMVRHLLFDKRYFKVLKKYNEIFPKEVDTRIMSATDLKFDDNTFDYITSDWVFEHIDDPKLAIQNIYRTLKKGGICRTNIHLFPSLSGSHNLDWRNADDESIIRTVPPWDHLREYKYPANVFLNKLKKDEFYKIFKEQFTILEIYEEKEGENRLFNLDSKIKNELNQKGYSDEDLTTVSMTIICQK